MGEGERVEKGERLFTIETDKISSEIEADFAGYLERAASVDAVLPIGAVIGYLHAEPGGKAEAPGPSPPLPVAPADAPPPAAPASTEPRADDAPQRRLRVSPVARRVAAEAGLAVAGVTGTGPGGSICSGTSGVPWRRSPRPRRRSDTPHAARDRGRSRHRQPSPPAGMRKAIAGRMMASLQSSAQMTGFARVDMAGTVELRRSLLEAEHEIGVRVTYTDIVLKACAAALAALPAVNASIVGEEIVDWARSISASRWRSTKGSSCR